MSDETKRAIDELKSRVEKLEGAVFGGKQPKQIQQSTIDIDVAALSYIKELKSASDKCIAILDYLFSRDSHHPGVTPNEFASILREKFGLPVPLQTISSQLYAATSRYVTRKKILGKPVRYRYQILPRGQEHIHNEIASLQGK